MLKKALNRRFGKLAVAGQFIGDNAKPSTKKLLLQAAICIEDVLAPF